MTQAELERLAAVCSERIEALNAELPPDSWDCGSGRCDPNTGCPSCSDEDRVWVRRS